MWLTLREISDRDVVACQMPQLNGKCYDCRTAGTAQFHTGLKVCVCEHQFHHSFLHEKTGFMNSQVFFFSFAGSHNTVKVLHDI